MIKTDQLNKVLPIIQPAVSARTMPILGMIKVDALADRIKLTASNTEMQIETECDGSSDRPVSFCIDADKIGRFSKSSNGSMISIAVKDGKAELKSKSKSKLDTMPSEYFPTMDSNYSDSVRLSAQSLTVANAIESVAYAASDGDPSRTYLNGILFRVSNGELTLIASDGYRMAQLSIDVEGDDIDCIIPKKTALTISKIFRSGDIDILLSRNSLSVFDGVTRLTGRCIDAKFPDFSRVIGCSTESIDIEINDFASAIDGAMLTSPASGRVDLTARDGEISALSTNEAGESSSSSLPCSYSGDVSISVNGRYMIDAIKKLPKIATAKISTGKAKFITLSGDDRSLHLVMGME
jgi:DNA polymerase-3 subunit beta